MITNVPFSKDSLIALTTYFVVTYYIYITYKVQRLTNLPTLQIINNAYTNKLQSIKIDVSYIHHAGKIGKSLPIPESPKAMREEGEILQSCPNDEYKINIPT